MYPTINIHYTNTTEYRQCIRSIFTMDSDVCMNNVQSMECDVDEQFDNETVDENLYDENCRD